MTEATTESPCCQHPSAAQPKVEVYDLRRTCIASPSQWEGRMGERGTIHIRYRWGVLSVTIAPLGANITGPDTLLYEAEIGHALHDRLGGHLETDAMCIALEAVCIFHGQCDEAGSQERLP